MIELKLIETITLSTVRSWILAKIRDLRTNGTLYVVAVELDEFLMELPSVIVVPRRFGCIIVACISPITDTTRFRYDKSN